MIGRMSDNWEALAEAVKRRREELRLTQGDIQERGGPSTAKLREIENRRTEALSPSKRRDLERALRWTPGSIDVILAGGQPTIAVPSLGTGLASLIPVEVPTLHDEHFDRAERLLRHSHESIRAGDHLGAIRGLEGVWSTVELLVDRITDEALLKGITDANESDAPADTPTQPDAPGEAGKGQKTPSPHEAKPRPDALTQWGRGGQVEDGNESA